MERELETRVDLPVVRVNRGGLYVIVAVLGIVIIASLSVTGYSLHNYAMLKRNAEELRQYIASRTNMSGLAGNDTPAAGDAVDHLRRSLKSLSGLAGNDTPAASSAIDHLLRSLKSLGLEATVPGLKPATPVKNRRTFVVQSINGTLVMIARQQGRPTNQNPGASRGAGGESPPAVAAVASKAPPEAYDILEASVSWNETHIPSELAVVRHLVADTETSSASSVLEQHVIYL